MHVSVTGIKPSGTPHLGNYLGMIRPALALVERTEAVYFVADYHAMTTTRDPVVLRTQSREVAATWLALGFDADRSVLYRQSDLPEVCELTWILSCVTPKGLLNRAHAYKAAVQDNVGAGRDDDAGVSMGLFDYPLLMAADILIHRADLVPVGLDQQQHVEITRDIAHAFNAQYGEVFVVPEALIDERVMTITGIDGRKMSKSYDNVVPILAARRAPARRHEHRDRLARALRPEGPRGMQRVQHLSPRCRRRRRRQHGCALPRRRRRLPRSKRSTVRQLGARVPCPARPLRRAHGGPAAG